MTTKGDVRIAVLGASGIGRHHVRELLRAGAELVAIQGRTPATAAAAAERIERAHGVRPRALTALEEVLALELDGVCIATPHELHHRAALAALTQGLFVFCEKPLLWSPGLGVEEAKPLLAELSMAGADRRLAVNTSNAELVVALRERGLLPRAPRRFRFRLATRGGDEGEDIGVDLLPHALSLVRELEPEAALEIGSAAAERHAFRAELRAGALAVELELVEHPPDHPRAARAMTLAFDDVVAERVQGEVDGEYRLALDVAGVRHPVEDPLRTWIGRFLDAVRGRDRLPSGFDASARILLDSLAILEAARTGAGPRR